MTAPASTASTRRTGTRNARSFSNERGDPQLRAAVGRPDYRRGNDEKNTKDGEGNGRIGSYDLLELALRLLERRTVPGHSTRARLNVVERIMP